MLNKHGGTESDLTVSCLAPGATASPLAPAFEGKRSHRSRVHHPGDWWQLLAGWTACSATGCPVGYAQAESPHGWQSQQAVTW